MMIKYKLITVINGESCYSFPIIFSPFFLWEITYSNKRPEDSDVIKAENLRI